MTPAPPPTNQWAVRPVFDASGILVEHVIESDDVTLVLDQWRDGDGREAAERVAAALNGGPDVEALRSVEPTAEQVEAVADAISNTVDLEDVGEYGYGGEVYSRYAVTNTDEVARAAIAAYRAALVREQTEPRCANHCCGRNDPHPACPAHGWLVREQTEGTNDG